MVKLQIVKVTPMKFQGANVIIFHHFNLRSHSSDFIISLVWILQQGIMHLIDVTVV